MTENYEEIHEQAERLYYQFRDKVDDPQSDRMQALRHEIKQIVEDIESGKKPRSIEDRVKQVMRSLKDLEHQGGGQIDFSDADELHDEYEDLRQEIRKLPNY